MLFYLFVILFASALVQAAPTESTITDLKGVIEEMTTLRPSTVNETTSIKSTDGSISTVTPETTKNSPITEIKISSTTTPTTNDEISTLTPETTTESFFVSTTPNELTKDSTTTTLTPKITTESFIASTTPIESTTDSTTTTLIPEMITDAPSTETEISITTTPSTNDEISTLTPETTTKSFFVSTTPNELTKDSTTTTLTPKITTESFIASTTPIESTTDNSATTTLIPEMITDAPTTETEISITITPTTNDEISTLTPETTTESFFVSTTPIESTTDSTTTTFIPEMITDTPTTETKISITTISSKNDEISSLTPETTAESFFVSTTPNELIEDSTTTTLTPEITTESFIASTTPFESITDGVFSTLTPESFPALTTPIESTTGAPISAFEAINTTLNPATIGVISTSTAETPTTEETAEQNNQSTDTAHIFHTSQFVLKHETPEYCNWYQINCHNRLNNQSLCTYSLVGDCNNFKAYQILPIKQLIRPFIYIPYTFNYQYVHKEQRSYGCNLYRVKCQHYYFINVTTEHCYHEYVSECSNYRMIHVINSSFY
ncbi:uncharacterized protein PB18E9.04c-like [Cotesia glomerata]|uniref:uncharacterized protein PB18E9.04c-like n=1 Tax=Cotesia glomerata TaxID=32391 RepID=UPI001D012C07|nr:uncharacterized protein PB18E9.04c-like [Cotesia glomerata]